MSAPATFSYAQAAKGQAPAPTNSQSASSSSQVDLHAKDDSSSVTTAADAAANTFSTTSEASESAKSSQMDVEVTASKNTPEVAHTGNSEAVDAPSKDEPSHTARSDETSHSTSQNTTSEKPTRSSTRSNEPADSRKGRKGKKGRNAEKESEGDQSQQEPEKEVVSVKLFEAPPPAVNFWQQRAALAKTSKPANVAPVAAGADAPSKAAAQDTPKGNSSAEGVDATASENARPAKSTDGSRSLDQRARRNPRGSRVGEQSTSGNPPPVEDVSLWPTPDTAATTAEDIKRKGSVAEPESSPKEKQEDGAPSKTSRPKYNVKMDINPSVRWETQMPQSRAMTRTRGGGQPGRGSVGRGGHASTASVSGEKLQGAGETSAPNSTGDSQGKPREEVTPRTNSLPSEKSKRFSVDTQDVRKSSIASGNRGSGAEYAPTSKNGATKASKNESQGFGGQQGPSRGDGAEQGRKEGGFSGHKDARPRRGGHGGGRGGHNGNQPHGQASFLTNGHGTRSNPYSPTFGASGYSYSGSSRGGRGRPISMNGFKGPANGTSKVPMQPIATDFGPYSPYGHGPHSAFPGVSPDYTLIHQALKAQIEYYFSATNLPKDVFLREHMDSQGFVPLEVIADFSRVRGISQRNLNFVREACTDSKDVEYVIGDGEELLRRRDGWEKYVLPEARRKEHARKPGPSNIQYRTRQSPHNAPNYHQQPHMPYPYPAMSPPAYGAPFAGDLYQGYMNAPGYHQGANGNQNEQSRTDNSQLNAAVPEFAPGSMAINDFIGSAAHTHGAWVEETLQAANIFTDEDVAKLQMVAQGQSDKASKDDGAVPNGDAPDSTVGYKVAETNGVQASSDAPNTPEQGPVGEETSSPTYWRLDGTLAQVSGDKLAEYYVDVRARALNQRQSANPGDVPDDMKRLYRFWAHSLVTHFNAGMYKEFRQLAIEDATSQVPSKNGLGNLLKFYHRVLSRGESETLSRPELPIYKLLQSDLESAQAFNNPVVNSEVQV